MVDYMLAVGPTDPEDVSSDVIEKTDTTEKADNETPEEYVARRLEGVIAKFDGRGATIRQSVTPSLDRFQDPSDVNPSVDFGR